MKKLLLKSFLFISFFAPMTVSCVNLDEVWNKIDSIEAQLDSIQNGLNAQMDALASLMSDGSTISSCVKDSDGSYVVTLSNGTKFTVLPDGADVSALVSCVEVEGVNYWATYGEDGELVPLVDADGNYVPVDAAISVEVRDGKYVLVVGEQEYVTGYDAEDVVSVFSSCTPHKDASGQIYAMTFTFGDGVQVTVTVDGYKGVIFKLSNAGASSVVSEYYLDYKSTQTFLMDVEGVVDYVMQIPDGWRVEEHFDALTSETYIDITAPAKETVEAGAAVADGDLKVVSVVEGGKAAITKLSLSTDPFKVYNVTSVKAVIEPYKGVEKFVYGLTDLATFDEAQVVTQVNTLLKSTGDLPKGIYMSDVAIDKTLEEIYGSEIPEGANLMFWVIPALYEEGKDNLSGGYYVKEDMLRTLMLAPVYVNMEISNVTVLDADLSVNVRGVNAIYAGTTVKSNTILEEIVYQINNGAVDSVAYGMNFKGRASQFPSAAEAVEMDPATTYVSWVVPVDKNKKEYLASDVIYKEFTTLAVKAGGTLKVTAGEPVTDCSSISIPVSSEGAAMIYYAWLNNTEGKRISTSDNETKMAKLLESANFKQIKAATTVAEIDFIKPQTSMWLFAVAIGQDGKYGEVVCKSAQTEAVAFNSLSVSIADPEVSATDATFTVSVSGGTASDFIYWCGKETDPFWLYEEFCDNSLEGAEVYMAANPDASAIVSIMKKNGKISADGKVKVSDLAINTSHVMVVLAKDETGKYSRGAVKRFKTNSIDLGDDFVAEGTDKWNKAKRWIEDNIVWDKNSFKGGAGNGQGFAQYSFSIKTPTDMTAFISCFSPEATVLDDMILELESFCSSSRDVSIDVPDPDLTWYDDRGKEHNASIYFNVYEAYVHGCTTYGYVTYFPSSGHNESTCPTWRDGECSAYAQKKEIITQKLSLDHWIEWVNKNCNYTYQGDPNHEYSYALTDETKVKELAQKILDAYTPYYKDMEPIVYVNDGKALRIINYQATGLDESNNVVDKVTVLLKDLDGNYYAPMVIQVPNYFKK